MVGWSSGLGFCHCRFKSSPLREQRWLWQNEKEEEGKDTEWKKTELENQECVLIHVWPSCRPRFSWLMRLQCVCVAESCECVCFHFCLSLDLFCSPSIYNSIRVEHGDYLEDVGLSKAGCQWAGAHQELQRALHYPAGVGLPRVHSGRQEDQWTIPWGERVQHQHKYRKMKQEKK